MRDVDVIVVGAGVMGVATARELARDGRSVVVLERFGLGHDRGSSHGSARIWRHAYTDPRYVRMMDRALPLWRELEGECGEQLLSVTGVVNLGPDCPAIEAAMGEGGAAAEWLEPEEVRARFPMLEVPGRALLDPLAGVVAADVAWRSLLDSARARGAVVEDNTRAELEIGGAGVTAGEWRAPVAVVTAGAWVQEHVPRLDVRVTRETVAYYEADLTGMPVVVEWGEPARYGLPTPDGTMKAAAHIAGPTIDPDVVGEPDLRSLEEDDRWVAARYGKSVARRVRAETCLYTNTPDGHFVLERHDNIVIGSACSGHGFKFAPLVGRRLADLAQSR